MGASSAAEEEEIYTDLFLGERSWNGRERNRLLLNAGAGWPLIDASAGTGIDDLRDGRGMAAADYDHDGDLDFAVANYEAPAALWINRWGQERRWVAVRLQGTQANRDGIGATCVAHVGSQQLLRVVGAGHGYAGQNSLEQLFGLGAATQIDSLEVRWPGGARESFGPLAAGSRVRLVQGEGQVLTGDLASSPPIESQRGIPLVPPAEAYELPTWLFFAMLVPPLFLILMATFTRKLGSGGGPTPKA